jgi:hypothetical protein
VDKLVKVWTHGGEECWVLVHVEVQTSREEAFPNRMFVYNYRIRDRYNRRVASLALLADDDANWRPHEYRDELFGCESVLRFPAVKLLDFAVKEAELETSANPFAKIVLAHLKARQTQGDPANRSVWKLRLIRALYEQGLSARDVRELFRVIDWLLALPAPLERAFWKEITELQGEKRMLFITTPQRIGRLEGMCEGIKGMLKIRFGDAGLKLMPEIEQEIHEEEKLREIMKALETVPSPEELRHIWSPPKD